jgi:hypothetical protein
VLQAAGEGLGFERRPVSRDLHVTLSDSGGGEEQPPLKNVTVVVLILEICHVCHGVTVTRRPPAQLCQKQKPPLELSYTFSNNKIKTYGREKSPRQPLSHTCMIWVSH